MRWVSLCLLSACATEQFSYKGHPFTFLPASRVPPDVFLIEFDGARYSAQGRTFSQKEVLDHLAGCDLRRGLYLRRPPFRDPAVDARVRDPFIEWTKARHVDFYLQEPFPKNDPDVIRKAARNEAIEWEMDDSVLWFPGR